MSAVAHCAVMRNPFSTAVSTARIPDGSAVLSSSSRLSISKRYNASTGVATMALYPGFTGHFFISAKLVNPSQETDNPSLDITSRTFARTASGSETVLTMNQNCPSKYRVTALGMRISLIENSENNDGWFEAIRIPATYDAQDFEFSAGAGPDNRMILKDDSAIFGGILGMHADASTFKNWAMNPTYITGKLRDINRHTFMCHRENDLDFVDVGNINNIVAEGGTNSIVRASNPKMWWADPNMDTILIRCFSATGSGTSAGMNFHVHTVQHVEEQFEPDTELARYMTKPPSNPALAAAVLNVIRREIKPSIVRAPTGAVSVRFSRTPRTYRRRKSVRRRVIKRKVAPRVTRMYRKGKR